MNQLDKMLDSYLCGGAGEPPPHMSVQKIQHILQAQKKRRLLIAVSVAALLWVMALALFTVCLYQLNPMAGRVLAVALAVGAGCAGAFSGLVLKFKKVGVPT